MIAPHITASRLLPGELLRSGAQGLTARRARSVLTALGIAIGIAAIIAVVGISSSSKAALLRTIEQLGTNLLAVEPGQSLAGEAATLPATAPEMIRRISEVEQASAVTTVDATVRRTDLIPDVETSGISVLAAEPELLDTLQGSLAHGRFLGPASIDVPAVVLGKVAAERLGITDLSENPMVYIGGHWFTVIGILEAFPVNPDLDRAALIGYPAAADLFNAEPNATSIYLRTDPNHVEDVRSLLSRTANPLAPNEVQVSRPSDALEAQAAVDQNLTRLLLGLGAVALIVGGVGIANVMVISVLERRPEIGLRRALGARRIHVANQFLVESVMLSTLGGVTGVGLGAVVTRTYAARQGWSVDVPIGALFGGVGVALLVGAIAGLYPAIRAARMDPAEAVHPTG